MQRYDIAIIGTGPAGLEAAITAKVRNKNILLLGEGTLSQKVEKAHAIQNYLGLPEISGEDMQKAFLQHLVQMGIEITEDRANTVYAMGDYFAIQGHHEMYEARAVILACGLFTAKPFPGEMENLGRGVSYCATCDAALYKGKKTIVLAYSEKEEEEAAFLSELAGEVTYLPMYEGPVKLGDKVKTLYGAKPLRIQKKENTIELELADGCLAADGLFILRDNVAPSQLVPGLLLEGNQVRVERDLSTNLPGLFACGDITGAPFQYIKAAGEGNVAALSAVSYLSAHAAQS